MESDAGRGRQIHRNRVMGLKCAGDAIHPVLREVGLAMDDSETIFPGALYTVYSLKFP